MRRREVQGSSGIWAGFIPGVIVYFNTWFPSEHRGRTLSAFYVIAPLGLLIGGPISSAVVSLNGKLGLAGWQWLFLLEGLPAIALGVVVLFYMTERPGDARWLSDDERSALVVVPADSDAGVPARLTGRHTLGCYLRQRAE